MRTWHRKVVASSLFCSLTIVLGGCSSPEEQIRSAAVGCLGDDAPNLKVADYGYVYIRSATPDDAECILKRLDAPPETVSKVRDLVSYFRSYPNGGYTEWGSFRVEVLPEQEVVLRKAAGR